MNDISSFPDFFGLDGASHDAIERAEEKLGLVFAPDYRQYVSSYGVASANGHELTGITSADRLDVVYVTQAEKKIANAIDDTWYVIERVGIDGVTAWQDGKGDVFITIGGLHPKLVSSSLFGYLSQ